MVSEAPRSIPPALRFAVLLLLAALNSACMTSRVEESKNSATGIAAGESVVILATSYHKGKAVEEDFVSCVSDQVQKGAGSVAVYPEQQFTDALFPWFEPRTAPQTAEALPELLARSGVAQKNLGARYSLHRLAQWCNRGDQWRWQHELCHWPRRWRLLRCPLVGRRCGL